MKKLAAGEVRFVVKSHRVYPVGKTITDAEYKKLKVIGWGVYDRVGGSYPYRTPELGEVAQDLATEVEATAEAERLNAQFVKQAPVYKKPAVADAAAGDLLPTPRKKRGKPVAEVAAEVSSIEEELPELPDYGDVVSDEEAAKYTDGIFEESKY